MRLDKFRVRNYRNIRDSGWIYAADITAFVGKNEAGKSNLFEALYCLNPFVPGASYNPDEDWPVDDWGSRGEADGELVCAAEFELDGEEIASLAKETLASEETDAGEEKPDPASEIPSSVTLAVYGWYGHETGHVVLGDWGKKLDKDRVEAWAKANLPKFVLIHDYEMSGTQVELDQLKARLDQAGGARHKLSTDDQTILVILDLAQIKLDDVLNKGKSAEGRTVRQFDKRSASRFLTHQFRQLWSQKPVSFEIDIDGPTLNIFAEDDAVGMPVRLSRRSTGFRWYVSFAWKFTHASSGQYQDCILLLEEPGIHLHYSGQRDLLRLFDRLSESNQVLYTTHLASMIDQSSPERVRIVESKAHHLAITHGVVSSQRGPMAVIEMSLGLSEDLSGMLGNRNVLIVEGGTDALILHKLSGLLGKSEKTCLSERIYLWPAHTASKTPMYAAFAVGQKWPAAVLVDTDAEGKRAKSKISELKIAELAAEYDCKFRLMLLGSAAGISKTDCAIEDLFPDNFYRDVVNASYGVAIKASDLPKDGSTMISDRVQRVMLEKHNRELDKKLVLGEMLARFDKWQSIDDLPDGTAEKAEKLFTTINSCFDS